MAPLPELNERDLSLIVRYELGSDEEMSEAVIDAFLAAGIEVYDKPTKLVDWINAEVFEHLLWTSNRPLLLSTRIWDHRVVMTADEVRIYRSLFSA